MGFQPSGMAAYYAKIYAKSQAKKKKTASSPLAKFLAKKARPAHELGLSEDDEGTLAHARAEMKAMKQDYRESDKDPAVKKEMEQLQKAMQTGVRGGSYYTNAAGNKVYLKK